METSIAWNETEMCPAIGSLEKNETNEPVALTFAFETRGDSVDETVAKTKISNTAACVKEIFSRNKTSFVSAATLLCSQDLLSNRKMICVAGPSDAASFLHEVFSVFKMKENTAAIRSVTIDSAESVGIYTSAAPQRSMKNGMPVEKAEIPIGLELC